jgi:hypothetical protein
MTFLHVTNASQVSELEISCIERCQFRKEHIEMAVDLNSTNTLEFVMKLLHFATDSASKFLASCILYGRCSRIKKLRHRRTSRLKSEFDHVNFAVAARYEKCI